MEKLDDYTYLFFDKAVNNDHSYTNKITSKITVPYLFTSEHNYVEGLSAIKEYNKFEGQENIPLDLNLDLFRPYMFNYSLKGAKIKIMIVAVNNKELEKYVKNKTQISNFEFFISLCNSNILYEKVTNGAELYYTCKKQEIEKSEAEIKKIVINPNANIGDPIEEQPEYCTVPLFEYQKKTVKWMKEREINKTQLYYNPNDELIIGNVLYDTGDQTFVLANNRKKIVFQGGALIDEVGLGKTYQMMVLSLQNQASNINYKQRNLKMLFSRATLVLCPNRLGIQWCDELIRFAKKEYNLNIVKLFIKKDHDSCTYSDLLDADFVITTFQFLENKSLQDQFRPKISQMKSYFSSSKSGYTYLETQNVLDELAKNALENPNVLFQSNPNIFLLHWHRIVIDEFHEIYKDTKYTHMIRLIRHLNGDNKWCMTGTPFDTTPDTLLSMFDFVTKYVNDMGNDIFLDKNVKEYLTKFFFRRNTKKSVNNEHSIPIPIDNTVMLTFSQTEWMIYNAYLANPNIDKNSVLMRQLCCHPGIADEIKETLSNCKTLADVENMMVKHYTKQTEDSEKKLKYGEHKLKLLQQKMKIFQFKRQGKYLKKNGFRVKYDFKVDTSNDEEIKKLEKYFANDSDLSLFITSDFFDDDNNHGEEDMSKPLMIVSEENKIKIEKALKKCEEYWETPKTFLDLKSMEKLMIEKLKVLENEYEGKKSTSNYYMEVMEKLKKTTENLDDEDDEDDENKEQCGICLGNIKGTDLGVTKCGHIFCYNCVKPFISNKPQCPVCSKPVKVDELYMVTQLTVEEKNTKEFKDKETLINSVGTKLANLIFFLKKNDKHCIIFSQWDDLLIKVGNVLNEYGINNVFCKGNIWQCTKAVNDFNTNDKIKVIMLSSKSSASGLNLTKAEMVILFDPIAGSYEDRRNTEWQAVGRAVRTGQKKQVQIVRFIIKNTIEEDIHKENLEENEKHLENIKTFELSNDVTELDEEKIEELNKMSKEKKPKKVLKKITKKTELEEGVAELLG